MTWTVSAVPFEAVADMWPTVLPMLQPAIDLSSGRIDADAVLEGLKNRFYVLWVIYPQDLSLCAAAVTHTAKYPRKSMLTVDLLGGHGMQAWLDDLATTFRKFAQVQGLAGVEMTGRPGWARVLSRLGWKHISVVCEMNAISAPGA